MYLCMWLMSRVVVCVAAGCWLLGIFWEKKGRRNKERKS
jgi:hypothetical protein